jgi:hypothetical protein
MLKTFAIAVLAMAMSVGLADAKGRPAAKQPPKMSCNAEQPASDTCACGPAKNVCQKGMFCHFPSSICSP